MLNEADGQAVKESVAARPAGPGVAVSREGGRIRAELSGDWVTRSVASVDSAMRKLEGEQAGSLLIDLSAIGHMGTAGAWLIERLATVSAVCSIGM